MIIVSSPWQKEKLNAFSRMQYWIFLCLAIAFIKTLLLMIDREPFFVIGDSAVYVSSALGVGQPSDRSFAYGLVFIRAMLALFGSLRGVVVAQSLCGAVSSLLLAVILEKYIKAPRWVSATAAILYSIEPISLLHERLMLTETVATMGFALFMTASIAYIQRPKAILLMLLAFLSTFVIAMRVSFLPTLFIVIAAVPFLADFRSESIDSGQRGSSWKQKFLHLFIILTLTSGCHAMYMAWFHEVTGQRPGYNSAGGLFLLGAWAPLVKAEDFPNAALEQDTLSRVKIPLEDRFLRPNHRFSQGGLIDALILANETELAANEAAEKITHAIARRDPFGVLDLAWKTYSDFWNSNTMAEVLRIEEGQLEVDQELIDHFRVVYNEDISGRHKVTTVVKIWHRVAGPWYLCVLLEPIFAAIAIFLLRSKRREMLLMFLVSLALLATATIPVLEPVVRFLHPLAWLTVLTLMSILNAGLSVGGSQPVMRRDDSPLPRPYVGRGSGVLKSRSKSLLSH
jgi:hypothetical protein